MGTDWEEFTRFCRSRFGAAGVWLVSALVLSHSAVLALAGAIGRGANSDLTFIAFFTSVATSLLTLAMCGFLYEHTLRRPSFQQQG